jgi:uncharacterized protein DUF4126
MQIASLIYGTGSVGPFASRAFVPAFITALVMRFAPEHMAWFNEDLVANASLAPTWFTSNATLIILGLLSVLEIVATKSPDLRAAYQEVDKYLKSIVAVITYLGLAASQDMQFIEQATQQAGMADTLPAMLVGVGVFWVSSMRSGLVGLVIGADEDDDMGVQKLFSWAEDVWSVFGTLLLVLFPVVMLLLVAAVTGLLAVARKRAHVREEKTKRPCSGCGEMIYGCAVKCFACEAPVAQPCEVGFLGQSLPRPAADLQRHACRLVEKKRCPVCANRFKKRAAHQTCSACGHELLADPAFSRAYLAHVDARLPIVLFVSFLFSIVPVIGLIPGVIYYRMVLIAPMRRYIPRSHAILLRWTVRILFFFLIMFQWVPIAGGLVVPTMALINYTVYRSAFRASLNNGGKRVSTDCADDAD